jgi:hypothetical protein
LLVAVLIACGTPAPTPVPSNHGVAPVTPETRCLPVVAKDCGCVYDCGTGARDGDHWTVTHAVWKGSTLTARIEPWCQQGACTDVFAAEIVCDGICMAKPADPTCHFAGSACVTGR